MAMASSSLEYYLEDAHRITHAWAATDSSATLSPFSSPLRRRGVEDVLVKVICCGICHSDSAMLKNHYGFSNYPMVPGHEVVGEVEEVGPEVTNFHAGDYVGVGYIVGSCGHCDVCKSGNDHHYCLQKIPIFNHKCSDGNLTHGGFASHVLVHQRFVVRIPKGMAPEQVAPLLCAGITAYSPLVRNGLNKIGLRGGILGLGGIGQMGLIIAKAMGHQVTVISSSESKREEALRVLGADVFILSSDSISMEKAYGSLDYIIDTLPVFHHLESYMNLLKVGGKLIVVGSPHEPLQFSTVTLSLKAVSIVGSFIGSVKEMEEVIKLFYEKGLTSKVEVVKMEYVNTALERLEKNDVRYKFVIDVAGSNLDS